MPVEIFFVVGHAQLPQGMAAKSLFDTLAVTAEFEGSHGVILRADVTLATEEGKRFVSNLLVGYSLDDGVELIMQDVRRYYHGAAQNAIVAAVKDMGRHYITWKLSRKPA
jgi:hypothetical protein